MVQDFVHPQYGVNIHQVLELQLDIQKALTVLAACGSAAQECLGTGAMPCQRTGGGRTFSRASKAAGPKFAPSLASLAITP